MKDFLFGIISPTEANLFLTNLHVRRSSFVVPGAIESYE
jgi:hypothetical protein